MALNSNTSFNMIQNRHFGESSPGATLRKGSSDEKDSWFNSESSSGNIGMNMNTSMNTGNDMNTMNSAYVEDDYDNEPPLLEELGVNFSYIVLKLKAVIMPNVQISSEIADDADMAGPFIFAITLGALMMLAGKLNFGYVFGFVREYE